MRIRNASLGCRMVAVLAGIAVFFAVAAANATIASKTADALVNNPNGGPGLVRAIATVLGSYRGKPDIIARAVLAGAADANDEQIAAIGEALADYARALESTDPEGAKRVAAVVADAKSAQLQKSFQTARDTTPDRQMVQTPSTATYIFEHGKLALRSLNRARAGDRQHTQGADEQTRPPIHGGSSRRGRTSGGEDDAMHELCLTTCLPEQGAGAPLEAAIVYEVAGLASTVTLIILRRKRRRPCRAPRASRPCRPHSSRL